MNLHVALWEPEIPPNTGNIGRLCAATDTPLHLIGKLGFHLDDRALLRAGLDFWPMVDVRLHASFADFLHHWRGGGGNRLIALSAKTKKPYTEFNYELGDCLLFGSESRGLPLEIQQQSTLLTIPMPTGKVRCLNLATSVGIVLYEAIRQLSQ